MRRARLAPLALLALLAVLAACGKETLAPVGTSDFKSRRTEASVADAGTQYGPSPLPDDFRTRFTKVKGPFLSAGHAAGRWQAQIYANEAGARALETRSRDVPVGAVVASEHFAPGEAHDPGPRFVMEKRPPGYAPDHGDWRYVAIASTGRIVDDGIIPSCAGCHDAAPADGLFPIAP